MKIRTLIVASTVACIVTASALSAGAQTRYTAKSGSKMRIEGTSNIHDWQVEGSLIGGYIEAGKGFPTEPGQAVTPGKVDAKAEAFVPIRSLKSVEKDGSKYSDKMDEVMYEHLVTKDIAFRLNELALKEAPKTKEAPYVFDAKGDLAVAGVTNSVSFPVNVTLLADGKMKASGTVPLKMTDFKIEPPAPKIALGMIKTGDDVKIIFDWNLGKKAAAAGAK
jgi:hypothetical protein